MSQEICRASGKIRFPNRGDARRWASQQKARREKKLRRPQLFAYPCRSCNGWHLSGMLPLGVRK